MSFFLRAKNLFTGDRANSTSKMPVILSFILAVFPFFVFLVCLLCCSADEDESIIEENNLDLTHSLKHK